MRSVEYLVTFQRPKELVRKENSTHPLVPGLLKCNHRGPKVQKELLHLICLRWTKWPTNLDHFSNHQNQLELSKWEKLTHRNSIPQLKRHHSGLSV
uniref:Uncharacterized protein n=1 Tax=Arundo donax TaxID=35708 RepID=A0A0A9GB00_ARUDO